jgi:hypothetical protein
VAYRQGMNEPEGYRGFSSDPMEGGSVSEVPRVFRGDRTATRASGQFFVVLLLLVLAFGLFRSPWTSGPVLYGTLEALSSLLAFVVGALALVRFYSKKQRNFLFIGTGFLGTGFLDFFPAGKRSQPTSLPGP